MPRPFFVPLQLVVALYAAVFFGVVTNTSQWAFWAVFSLIMREFLPITGLGCADAFIGFLHALATGAYIKVFVPVVMQIFLALGPAFGLVKAILLAIEGIVLYKRGTIFLNQQFIILLASLTSIGGEFFQLIQRFLAIKFFKNFQMTFQSIDVISLLLNGVIYNDLVFGRDLCIYAGFSCLFII
ncbi:hypothetical protein P0M11_11305 [Kaistella sp. PBT33-4]|uniref:hypothetical protein n=1 Tax=Kaistella sp. PBT33-4 TaxID=3032000 RepID=UPI0023D8BC6F|nr:hypothetical protein [Kaistella sp. PBT33-4]MDF0720584.1 hypothetical protein [Kaistella sp. PBT33-4]